MKAYQAVFAIATMCHVLEVSKSGYYTWCKRAPSAHQQEDVLLGDRIEALHRQSRNIYGRPRLQADLLDEDIHVGDKRVARLMRERKIHGASRRRGFKTTVRDVDARPAPDLVERKFIATAPDSFRLSEFTASGHEIHHR